MLGSPGDDSCRYNEPSKILGSNAQEELTLLHKIITPQSPQLPRLLAPVVHPARPPIPACADSSALEVTAVVNWKKVAREGN